MLKTTPQSPLSLMWRHGWNGRPNSWAPPTWWTELQAIPGIRDPWKLAWKIRASFYIPEVRMRTLLEPGYTVPPTLRSLDRNAFLPNDLSYQDMCTKNWLSWLLLMPGAFNTGQKNRSPLRSQNLCPLAESVMSNYGRQWKNMLPLTTKTSYGI